MFGDSFIFSKSTQNWRAKRKSCSNAFYKEKLTGMIESFRDLLEETFGRWERAITTSAEGALVIDIAQEFNEIMSRNIVTIILGEDITEEEVEIKFRENEQSYQFVTKRAKLCQVIDECFQ